MLTTALIHPAHQIPYDRLAEKLEAELNSGNVFRTSQGDLDLYCYTKRLIDLLIN